MTFSVDPVNPFFFNFQNILKNFDVTGSFVVDRAGFGPATSASLGFGSRAKAA